MASMTLSSLRSEVIRLGRVGSNVASTVLNTWINEGIHRLQYDTKWLAKVRYFYIREYFSVGTDEGLGVILATATGTVNVIGSDTAYTDITGSSMAQLMSTQWENIVGDTGVLFSYSTANRKFTATIDTGTYNSTGIVLVPPLYDTTYKYDYLYKLFGVTDGQTSASTYALAGDEVPFGTSEYPLPSDFLQAIEARYQDKNYPFQAETFKYRDVGTGTPFGMYVRDGYFGLTPQPTDQGYPIELHYYYIPADLSTDSETHPFSEEFDYAIVFYAVALYKHRMEDTMNALKWESKYEEEKRKAVQRKRSRVGGGYQLLNRSKRRYDVRRYNL